MEKRDSIDILNSNNSNRQIISVSAMQGDWKVKKFLPLAHKDFHLKFVKHGGNALFVLQVSHPIY